VACLAALLDFDACGIEVEPELVDAAQQLADDFDLPVEFVQGSFLPAGYETGLEGANAEFAWLSTEAAPAYGPLGLDPDSFDVTFAYPWPDEEWVTERLFERHGRPGALLMTYHGGEDLRLRRKKVTRWRGDRVTG
jgi:hypothetical protein